MKSLNFYPISKQNISIFRDKKDENFACFSRVFRVVCRHFFECSTRGRRTTLIEQQFVTHDSPSTLIKKEHMTYVLPKRAILPLLTILPLLVTGCASVAVSNDAIEQNTAQALGLAKGTFTTSDRVDDGMKASYSVKTNTGKQYTCYVTGTVSIIGRVVSDAVCTELRKDGSQANTNAGTSSTGSASCNALLKAAGKCR